MRQFVSLIFIVLLSSGVAAADNDISAMLALADEVKTKKPAQFVEMLDEVSQRLDEMNTEELNWYKYLDGFRLGFSGKPDAALANYDEVIAATENVNLLARAISAKVNIYAITRDIANGYTEIQNLMAIIDDVDADARLNIYVILSIFYNQIGDYESALSSADYVINNPQIERTACFAKTTRNEALINLGIADSVTSFDEAIVYCESAQELIPTAFNVLHKSSYLITTGAEQDALRLLETRKPLFEKTQYPISMSAYHAQLAELLIHQSELEEAKKHAEIALSFTTSTGLTKPKIQATQVLSAYYEQQGDLQEALAYARKSAEIEKAYLDDIKVNQLAIQKAKNEMLEKESQIKLLDKENDLLKIQAALNREQQDYNQLAIIGLMLIVTTGLIWIIYSRKMTHQLRKLAHFDGLTKIPNRRHFTQLGEAAISYHQKTSQPISFIIFDLDLFKRVNDDYGHAVGDWALKAAARTALSIGRKQDIVGRLGGEEFALILPGCDKSKAIKVANDCREAIARIDTSETGHKFDITASFGVTDSHQSGYKFDQLYANADAALYISKDNGRNCAYTFDRAPVMTDSEIFSKAGAV
tara:strand:+ start:1207 stop:2970 length:1764 start_codon:yes stop_codon:yes gene_type:complete